ncbi:putative membrane protein DUF2306 [Pedobacter psychrotolerans]|uniref:Putative membrane protein DUF2306 n=1 Tax=Pedobacter psychrotolerans TaxID=1843235 RepID=A0A4R2HM04_9SPHI|nr:DUF2306 domain-containing protein [Pedobacter psychrotolerans]TCO31128.1 putative membrane protein DUF2306 [Pedobacter psychrotolerans]GGE42023.1 hypothetical protein GCM10011413_04880 [Pedobacter psychrotolerans]
MKKKIFWVLFGFFSITIGLYPLKYFLINGKVGILNAKPEWLLSHVVWYIAFYIHIVLGGVSLLVGWLQFSTKLRLRNVKIHRCIGKIYVVSALFSSFSGSYIALFADGGFWSSLGFSCLGIIWFFTTLMAYLTIWNQQIVKHQVLMTYSYAACFAAVTLRIWLPILILIIGNYNTAYIIVAWLSWIPNLLVAYLITNKLTRKSK